MDKPLERSCTEVLIVTLIYDSFLSGVCYLYAEPLVFKTLAKLCKHKVNDLVYLRLHKRLVVDYIVKSVKKLRSELLFQQSVHLVPCFRRYLALRCDALKDIRRTKV